MASPEGSSGACVLAIGEGFSYFGQNCCTLLRAAQGAAGSKGKASPPRLARRSIECTQLGATIAALAMGVMPTIFCW